MWSFITYFVGTKFLSEPQTNANYDELLRTVDFSSSPGLIRILGIIPVLGGVVFFVASALAKLNLEGHNLKIRQIIKKTTL